MAVLRLLLDRTGGPGRGRGGAADTSSPWHTHTHTVPSPFAAVTPALEALGRSLSDAERGAFAQQLLARAAAAPDPRFHDALYATLVQAG